MKVIYEPKGRAKEYADLACNNYTGCTNSCRYCLCPNTPILMYDGIVKRIADINVGESVYGVKRDGRYRKFCESVVLNKWTTRKPSYRVTLASGKSVVCSADHRWLAGGRWKHTITESKNESHLTYNDNISGFISDFTKTPEETEMYKKGYIAGVIRGDGTMGEYSYKRRGGTDERRFFRLAMKEESAVLRAEKYLFECGVETHRIMFPMKDRKSKQICEYTAIYTENAIGFYIIKSIIELKDDPEFRRGWLAGLYDAEGSSGKNAKCFYNANDEIVDFTAESLSRLGFMCRTSHSKTTINSLNVREVRIIGGWNAFVRFFALCNPAIHSKKTLNGIVLKIEGSESENRVVNIEKISDDMELIDITTSTENFIANGLVSHNCFAPNVMRSDREKYHLEVTPRTDAIMKWFEHDCIELEKKHDHRRVHMNFISDPYPEVEKEIHLTRFCIETAMKHGVGINILTKGKFKTVSPDMELFKEAGVHFGVTCCWNNDKYRQEWEPNASTVEERCKLLMMAHEMGIFTWVSMEPVVYPNEAMEFYRNNKQYVDLWKVGKLNYHPHAKEVDWCNFRTCFELEAKKYGSNYILKKDLLNA